MSALPTQSARCQHCPCAADERSFMCSDCSDMADGERDRYWLALRVVLLAPIGEVSERLRSTARIALAGDEASHG